MTGRFEQPINRALGEYLTPIKDGPVRVADVTGGLLTLKSTGGTTFVFDVDSFQYVPTH